MSIYSSLPTKVGVCTTKIVFNFQFTMLWHKKVGYQFQSNIFNQQVLRTIEENLVKINGKLWIKTTDLTLLFSNLDNSLSKTKIKKNFFVPYSTLDELSNDTSLNSLRSIYRSAKIVWTKKPIWVYSSSPTSGSEQLCKVSLFIK